MLLNVYVIMGVLYNAVRNKASGAALFSHVILLKAIPGLVKVVYSVLSLLLSVDVLLKVDIT